MGLRYVPFLEYASTIAGSLNYQRQSVGSKLTAVSVYI